jgi:Arc/MetJ-type ribon-helix-helix transcriptional regulator
MQIHLNKPELRQFIDDQVKAGRFDSVDSAVEAAVEQMMLQGQDELDDETVAAIQRAEAQIDRGEGTDFATLATALRKRMAASEA